MRTTSVSALQAIQGEFDRTHNLERISLPSGPYGHRGSTNEQITAAAFAALALAGECGEVANAVKKAVRAVHLGLDPTTHLEFTRRELADVLAYLLKIATILDSELGDDYLETVALNSLRFSIGSEGDAPKLIGVGGSDTAIVAATVARIAPSFAPDEAQFVDLSPPTLGHGDSITSWVEECSARVALSFERTSNVIIVRHDPAFHVHRARQEQHSATGNRFDEIDALVKYEQLAWRNAAGRQLIVLEGSRYDDTIVIAKLRNHGAFVLGQPDGGLADALSSLVRSVISSKVRGHARSDPSA